MAKNSRIIIFTRYPEPGRTKTRLIPVLGAQGAAALYRKLTEHTVTVARKFARKDEISVEVRFDLGSKALVNEWLGDGFSYREQIGLGLGERMWRAFQDAFDDGCERVLLIGCDCPGINGGILDAALARLDDYDVVFGPANDGGYYLVGMSRPCRGIFREMAWGSDRVLEQTVRLVHELGLSVAFVDALDDIDRPEDLSKLNAEKWIT